MARAQDALERPDLQGAHAGGYTIWRFEGDAKMLAVTEQQREGKWVEAWRIAFSRE